MKLVLDTNIIVSALMSADNACRAVIDLAFDGEIEPLMGRALHLEYESVLARDHIFKRCPFDLDKRNMFLDDILSVCRWVDIYYLWRPNLRDEGDNHVMELAIAGGAGCIVTQNIKDLTSGDLLMPQVNIERPHDFLQNRRTEKWQH